MPTATRLDETPARPPLQQLLSYVPRLLALAWSCGNVLGGSFLLLTILEGVLPGATAWVSRMIVDTVLRAAHTLTAPDRRSALFWVGIEALLVVMTAIARRGGHVCNVLMEQRLGYKLTFWILEKAVTLELPEFENTEFHERLRRATRWSDSVGSRLLEKALHLLHRGLTLVIYSVLLVRLSPWTLLVLVAAATPSFLADARFSVWEYYALHWKSAEYRLQSYLSHLLVQEDAAKEVKLFGLGPMLLERYRHTCAQMLSQDTRMVVERAMVGVLLTVLSSAALYGAYAWIVWQTVRGILTVGDMTMYVLVIRQSHSAVSDSLNMLARGYEDLLHAFDVFSFLDRPRPTPGPQETAGLVAADGLRLEHVTFTYPGATTPALQDVTLHIPVGRKLALVGENGSGKTTLTKLLTRLYRPDSGRILLDGRDLQDWDEKALRPRFSVIFQDYLHYQFMVGENIGVGDVAHMMDQDRWHQAAVKGMADSFIERLPQSYRTPLGRLAKGSRELSSGQWQKVALARAFMRQGADVLVLDEPTSAIDPQTEAEIFDRLRELTADQTALLISHRFSTVRMADEIVVLHEGRVVEQGTHADLLAQAGVYARLFLLQAEKYR